MQRLLVPLLGASLLALTTLPTHAQTYANGPYYATPSWDQTMPTASRFVILANFANAAVLDRETGLVWQQTPTAGTRSFADAYTTCLRTVINGRVGWRLPTITELESLLDLSTSSTGLPAGTPFTLPPATIFGTFFWSTTTFGPGARLASGYFLQSPSGNSTALFGVGQVETVSSTAWCVRGPGDPGQYQQ